MSRIKEVQEDTGQVKGDTRRSKEGLLKRGLRRSGGLRRHAYPM
jgi:hypothetical protein